MIPVGTLTADDAALAELRRKLITPPVEPIFTRVFDEHADRLDLNFDRDDLTELSAMEKRTRPQEQS